MGRGADHLGLGLGAREQPDDGVEGDAHAGVTVKHRSRVARDPTLPNLRQVHLVHAELHDEHVGGEPSAGKPGHFDKTIEGIKALRAAKIPVVGFTRWAPS